MKFSLESGFPVGVNVRTLTTQSVTPDNRFGRGRESRV